jgi:hypothetical protein
MLTNVKSINQLIKGKTLGKGIKEEKERIKVQTKAHI